MRCGGRPDDTESADFLRCPVKTGIGQEKGK